VETTSWRVSKAAVMLGSPGFKDLPQTARTVSTMHRGRTPVLMSFSDRQ